MHDSHCSVSHTAYTHEEMYCMLFYIWVHMWVVQKYDLDPSSGISDVKHILWLPIFVGNKFAITCTDQVEASPNN